MTSWGMNRSRSDRSPARGSTEVHGKIRVPGDDEPLAVTIRIADDQVAMTSVGGDLGIWQARDVRITRIDPWTFAFVAEGDRLVFVPDDARAFATHPLIGATASPTTKRTTRRPKLRMTGLRTRVKRPRRTRAGRDGDRDTRTRDLSEEPVRTTQPAPVKAASAGAEPDGTRRPSLWLRSIDTLRENGLLGLDRVPVSERQRGSEHQHTYLHGAAAPTGLGRRVCTICGKVRLRS